MGSTSFQIHRLLQCFGWSRAAIAALLCHQHSIFCVNLQGKPWFCTKVLCFKQKISSIFIQHDRASAPARSSVFLSLFVPLSGKSPHPVGGRRSHPFRFFKQHPLLFCYYNRTARQIPWPASFPAFFEQYWKARGVRRGPFPFPFYALFPFFAQCRVMLETMALSSSAV